MPIHVDTNVLIYDSVEDAIHHEQARDVLNDSSSWYIPLIVVYEYLWFFRTRDVDVSTVRNLLANYLDSPRSSVIGEKGEVTGEAVDLLLQNESSLQRFNDMVILASCREEGHRLASFDGTLRTEAEAQGIEPVPETVKPA